MAPAQGWHAQFEKKFQHFFLFQISEFDPLTWHFLKNVFFSFLFIGFVSLLLWDMLPYGIYFTSCRRELYCSGWKCKIRVIFQFYGFRPIFVLFWFYEILLLKKKTFHCIYTTVCCMLMFCQWLAFTDAFPVTGLSFVTYFTRHSYFHGFKIWNPYSTGIDMGHNSETETYWRSNSRFCSRRRGDWLPYLITLFHFIQFFIRVILSTSSHKIIFIKIIENIIIKVTMYLQIKTYR